LQPRGYSGHFTVTALRLHFLSLVSPLLAFLAANPSSAQSTTANTSYQAPTLRTNTQAVAIDVVVTNAKSEPVLSLRQQHFQLLEDGKPQAIDLFEEHAATLAAHAASPLQLPPHVYTNQPAAPQGDAVNVLLLDNLNTETRDQIAIHKQIASFLDTKQPGTQIAMFTLGSKLQLAQGFTADASLLRAALNSSLAKTPANSMVAAQTRQDEAGDNMQQALNSMSGAKDAGSPAIVDLKGNQRGLLTLQALEQLSRYLAGFPGRKNLIWFAGSFPVAIFPTAKEQQSLSRNPELTGAVRETAGLLTASKVAVYPVDAQGIHIDRSMDADSGGRSQGDNFSTDTARDLAGRTANTAAMDQLAADTGGEAFHTSNDLSKSVHRAIENGSHYYTLVYTPPGTQMDGKFHRIEIKLTEGKATLSYRRGYYADSPSDLKPVADPRPPLLAHGLPDSTQILFQARVLPLAQQPASGAAPAGGNAKLTGALTRYKVDLDINPASVALQAAADGMHNGKIEVALVAYDQAGRAVNWTGETLGLNLNPAAYAQVQRAGIPVHLQIDLPTAELSLSTGVCDLTAHKAGTLEIALTAQSSAAP
jgi:VWFA-related protein